MISIADGKEGDGIEVQLANDDEDDDDDDNNVDGHDDDASQLLDPNKIVKCPSAHNYHTICSWHCLATVRCRPSCFTVLLTIKLLLCILKLMHKVHAPGETHTHTHIHVETHSH